MRKWDLRLDNYEISKKRYRELCAFCEQYPEWKHFLATKTGEPGSPGMSDMPKAPFRNSDNVGDLAVKRVSLEAKCKLIEDVAKQTDEYFADSIIKAVCYEVPVTYLQTENNGYFSKSSFYRKRRKFFYLLDKAKE